MTDDDLWGALLRLDDAAAFVEVATRLDWKFQPRGFDNVELHDRYGDGILPWLATRLDADGILHNHPWCVVPCLLRCGGRDAFELAWRVRGITGRTAWGGCGDGDLVVAWAARHPEVAAAELERLAPVDARARAHLRAMGVREPTPTADDVLALLDACAAQILPTRVRMWPPEDAQVRVIAARDGGDWVLALEWIDGTRPTGIFAARVTGIRFGSRVSGVVDGVALTSRAVPDLGAADLDARLGPPELAVPGISIVAVVPHVGHAPVPSASPLFQRLAAALTS